MPRIKVIIPLMSKHVSHNWNETSTRLSNTLHSVLRLDASSVSVTVVGHDIPDGVEFGSRCRWVPVDFPSPSIGSLSEKMEDKGLKIRTGLRDARAGNDTDWVMFMDADDFVSKELLVDLDFEKHDAICMERGYRWVFGDCRFELIDNFHRMCGTSWLMRLEPHLFPVWLGGGSNRVCDQAHNSRLFGLQSISARVQMAKRPAVVYLTDHGGNSFTTVTQGGSGFGKKLVCAIRNAKRRVYSRRITPEMHNEFSLPQECLYPEGQLA